MCDEDVAPPFQLATLPGFQVHDTLKGNLVRCVRHYLVIFSLSQCVQVAGVFCLCAYRPQDDDMALLRWLTGLRVLHYDALPLRRSS